MARDMRTIAPKNSEQSSSVVEDARRYNWLITESLWLDDAKKEVMIGALLTANKQLIDTVIDKFSK